ncbi:MAG: phosphoesterase PA-phosphatase [Paenibacillus sp.]|jgi:undecaprenyl-diphosphatase|nr:phosphoesterase PA-phosphatase [Paenibacillus sp.]
MNLKWQLPLTFLISLFCLAGFGLIALMISARKLARFDDILIGRIQGAESPDLTYIMKFFTFIGAGMPAAIVALFVMLLLYKFLHHRKELILFLWVVLGSALLNVILKLLFQRARPDLYRIIDINGFSFPSGHSMAAFSLYGILAFLIWRHIRTAFGRIIIILIGALMILAVGISRIYLGVHYPSDVLGGYLASGFWMSISIWLFQKNSEKALQG